ncbi:MAG: fatty acid desaturase family protein [Myxococcaceae bacterium]|nr:fatty acid desaturase family protein [Myxococcaceae bacterium]
MVARIPAPQEYVGVFLFFGLFGALAFRLAQAQVARDPSLSAWLWIAAAAFAGYVVSDFVSGLVHWTFDTWGSNDSFIVGKAFIHHFRMHHFDPKDITRHGFVATNGNNCLATLPALAAALFIPLEAPWASAAVAFVVSLCLGVFMTNQFHKWAHADAVGPFVAFLQASGLALGREHHDIHHRAPFDTHYCITTGWLNRPLMAIGFFRGMERLISRITGAVPRRDDLRDPER